MGAVLAFPSMLLDYTDEFPEWEQQTFRELPKRLQSVIERHETKWEKKWRENMGIMWESTNLVNKVYPRIWIGTVDCAESTDTLEAIGINVVLNMALECEYRIHSPYIRQVRIGIHDGALTNRGVLEKAADVVYEALEAEENILVHCAAGVSRSCAAVVSYLMLHKGIGLEESLEILRHRRPCVNPHPLLVRSMMRDFGGRFIP